VRTRSDAANRIVRWARIANPRGRVQLASASPLLALVRADPGVGLLNPMARFDSGRAHPLSVAADPRFGFRSRPPSVHFAPLRGRHCTRPLRGFVQFRSTPSREAPRAPAGSGLRFAIPTALGSTPRLEADRIGGASTISALVAADPPARLRPLLTRFDSEQARRGKGRPSSQPSFIRSARPVQHGSRSNRSDPWWEARPITAFREGSSPSAAPLMPRE
jgi:hypothetical protein